MRSLLAWRLPVLALTVLTALGAAAHSPPPAHGCQAPVRPVNDQDDRLWQRFLDGVDGYRACISGYATSNRAAADAHQRAANDATGDWNRFVRNHLNVPEDYPWPPPPRDPR